MQESQFPRKSKGSVEINAQPLVPDDIELEMSYCLWEIKAEVVPEQVLFLQEDSWDKIYSYFIP